MESILYQGAESFTLHDLLPKKTYHEILIQQEYYVYTSTENTWNLSFKKKTQKLTPPIFIEFIPLPLRSSLFFVQSPTNSLASPLAEITKSHQSTPRGTGAQNTKGIKSPGKSPWVYGSDFFVWCGKDSFLFVVSNFVVWFLLFVGKTVPTKCRWLQHVWFDVFLVKCTYVWCFDFVGYHSWIGPRNL